MIRKERMSMKFVGFIALVCLAGPALAADVRVVEEIVAKVNNEIITRGDLQRTRLQLEQELKRQGITGAQFQEAMKEADQNLLREKIDQMLLVQKAKDANINVDADVTKRLAQYQLEQKLSDPDKFQAFVRQETGMPFEDFKQQIKDSILTQRVIGQEVGSRINVPKADIEKYYNEHKNEFVREEEVLLREIFVSTEGKDAAGAAAAEKKAKSLVARARAGEKFGDLARDNSDAATARNYGELPSYKREQLDPAIADIVFLKDKGFVSDPIKRPNGFEILKVEDRYKAGLQPLEVVQNDVMERLYTPKMQPALRTFLTKLRSNAFLEIRPGFMDSGAAPGKDTSWRDPAQLKPQTVTKEEVAMRIRRRRLLWMLPVPGSQETVKKH
jgi:peptidyl-prolyl cis-trans isomerase SurA